MQLTFRSDTSQRKNWFTGMSFSHPAKLMLPLQIWLYENYTKPGDTVLDPMAGSGTVLVGCSMGRNVICVELEPKFIDIIQGNWQKIQQRGPMLGCELGRATIIQGDARNLEGLLVDAVITSPPYEGAVTGHSGIDWTAVKNGKRVRDFTADPAWTKAYKNDAVGFRYSENRANIGNLKAANYLESMSQVYAQCYKVLKPGGLLILVVKNFIREKKEVRLDLDTIRLCEQAGLALQERHFRKLTQKSFWRILYARKYPMAPSLDREDILVLRKDG